MAAEAHLLKKEAKTKAPATLRGLLAAGKLRVSSSDVYKGRRRLNQRQRRPRKNAAAATQAKAGWLRIRRHAGLKHLRPFYDYGTVATEN